MNRCDWATSNPLMTEYHDTEWGVPLHDDRALFEFLVLEGMQAGLSWNTILHKRSAFREAFDGFDPVRVAHYTERDVARLLGNAGIIRNGMKIRAAINNAQRFLEVREEFGTFDAWIWQFTGGRPIVNRCKTLADVPCRSAVSDAISRDLIRRGFKFVGSTIVYAHMQATGMVNDHLMRCFRFRALARDGRQRGNRQQKTPRPFHP